VSTQLRSNDVRISARTQSKYLRAADIGSQTITYTVRDCREETMRNTGENKAVVYFREIAEGLVLNKTNEQRLAEDLGDDTDDWRGRRVVLDAIEVDFRGDMVRSIRARGDGKASPAAARPTRQAVQSQAPLDDLDDEIPF
jgi:hypothetical protein